MRGVGKPCMKLASISRYAMTAVVVSGDLRNCEISLKLVPDNYVKTIFWS
jgi:hypothetical protein